MEETVSCELEAAEALAGLSRSSAPRGAAASDSELQVAVTTSPNPEVQRTAREHTAVVVGNPEKTNLLPSNPGGKSRSKLTEDEKEARRIRRILANRESARQAIRRRQAMYLELKGKAAHALEENECLKKEKEQALKEYTSLKERNEFLKAQIAKIDKAKQDVSETDKFGSTSAAGGTSSPTLMPCVWPYTDAVQFQSHGDKKPCLHNFFLSDDKPCAHKGQQHETSSISTGQGIPVFLVPVPWLLPLLSHNMTTLHVHPCNGQEQSSLQHGTVGDNYTSNISNHQLQGSDFVKTVPGFLCDDISGGGTRLFESVGATRNVKGVCDTTSGIDVVSPSESDRHRSLLQKKNQEPVLCPKNNNTNDATEIRRKRKELMKMKYLRFHHDKTQY